MDKSASQYHYASVELLITKALFNRRKQVELRTVLDIGSGAGHWIRFYRELGAAQVCGIDVSKKAVDFLENEF